MTFDELLAAHVKAAVHAALDERDAHAWPELLTLEQVEARYGGTLKASTLRALILSGELEASKPGAAYLVSPDALRAYLERHSLNKPTKERA